jgi:folate-dependent tRNA-U54 methylase TrmFO/GidA
MDFVLEVGGTLRLVREDFSKAATETVHGHPNIEVVQREATEIPTG